MPYIFGKLWHLAIIWAIRKAFQFILQGVRILLANHTRISPTSENDSYNQRIRTDGFSSGATFRDGCQPDPQCLKPFQLQVDFAFISSPTNCWLSEEVFRFHPMILAKFRQAGRQLCESHEGEVWLSSEKGNSYKFFIVGNGSNNTRITSLPGSFILFGNLVLVYLKSY